MSERILVMGDIHGNSKAMEQCLDRCEFDSGNDTLIQLGDVCDRHPDSVQVIEKLLRIPKLIVIRGNHDPWLQSWLSSGETDPVWSSNGGIATIESYLKINDKIDRSRHITFLENQKNYYIDKENRLFIHAGFTHPKGPQHETPISNCYWDRRFWNETMQARVEGPKPDRLDLFREIFIGHTPTLNWQQDTPIQAFNVWNLDTGAGWNGKLTVMDVETKEYWQSDFAGELYI
ncbi:metallophosphoesterase [Ekhidna sp.]|uniref:metallophosphoesterase n=1 Tax=Ekhidna sp. TaxID=2608089 RepID=UPI003B58F216